MLESELRKRFVIVTALLMSLVLTIFYTAMHFYYNYWFDQDTLSFIDWVADSESKRMLVGNQPENYDISEWVDSESVIAAVVTQKGDIIIEKHIGTHGSDGISEELLNDIMNRDTDDYKSGEYIYTVRDLSNDKFLIVTANTDVGIAKPMRLITKAALVLLALTLMAAITFLLSKFVTKPAAAAMLREKQFISDASHELKTPLGAISINAQALSSRLPESYDDLKKYTENIQRESDRMNRLVERLLMLSRIEEGKGGCKKRISLSDCVEEMILTFESVAFEKGLAYESDVDEDLFIKGDEDEIKQLGAILIDNAIKHSNDHGSIEISLKKRAGKALLAVTNTGKGIYPQELEHVFERFYKTDEARSSGSFGLGLAIAKAITDEHGASISVESELDGSTKFEVIFGL